MIWLTRINHQPLVVNSDLIEHIESTPDTVISMTTGQKFIVLEPAGEVIARVIAFRRAAARPEAGAGAGESGVAGAATGDKDE